MGDTSADGASDAYRVVADERGRLSHRAPGPVKDCRRLEARMPTESSDRESVGSDAEKVEFMQGSDVDHHRRSCEAEAQ